MSPHLYSIDVSMSLVFNEAPSPNEAAEAVIKELRERVASGTADGCISITDEEEDESA